MSERNQGCNSGPPNRETTQAFRAQQTWGDEIIEWCAECMASYKQPRYVEFRDGFPMTATGKIPRK